MKFAIIFKIINLRNIFDSNAVNRNRVCYTIKSITITTANKQK